MSEEEQVIATAGLLSRFDDIIMVEELALAGWQGQCGLREQTVRVAAFKRARGALAQTMPLPAQPAQEGRA